MIIMIIMIIIIIKSSYSGIVAALVVWNGIYTVRCIE